MTPEEALKKLHESAYLERNAPIWVDHGRTVARLAHTAGVTVVFAHVDLTAQTTEYRTVDGTGQQEEHTA